MRTLVTTLGNEFASVYDLIIRGGTVVDGLGGEPVRADVAITDGVIQVVGAVTGSASREIDARGALVTPGFVDVHTHYDGQAIWSDRLTPSSMHGVTTVVMGNCGVGFAPCRKADREKLVSLMAGVEDIPGVVMAEGLPWSWETFPDFMDELEVRPHDIDLAVYLPHSPVRVFVMGDRGVNREPATDDDLSAMRAIAKEAAEAGAIGFATSQLIMHKTAEGDQIPSWGAAEAELQAIAEGLRDGGASILQAVPEAPLSGYEPVLSPLINVAEKAGVSLTFTLSTRNDVRDIHLAALELMERSNTTGGNVVAQVLPRPIGLIVGLDLSAHPFVACPSYVAIAELPLSERVMSMRDPEVRKRILAEELIRAHPLAALTRNFDWLFPMGELPDYEPDPSTSVASRAAARGVSPLEHVYDLLLGEEGRALLLLAISNFQDASLEKVSELIVREDVVVGLGDGGAHYGMLCDASYTTFMVAYWARDRSKGPRIPLPHIIKMLTSEPASVAGLLDRGQLRVGYKADINIIDFERLQLHRPTISHDLPGGGKRLNQQATGYRATIVSGEPIVIDDRATDARPGRLIRGGRSAPA